MFWWNLPLLWLSEGVKSWFFLWSSEGLELVARLCFTDILSLVSLIKFDILSFRFTFFLLSSIWFEISIRVLKAWATWIETMVDLLEFWPRVFWLRPLMNVFSWCTALAVAYLQIFLISVMIVEVADRIWFFRRLIFLIYCFLSARADCYSKS